MTSKIQQAKNEKQLKELARLSENKRCAICTCMGTQYTCQPPHIFVCSACAGAIYHFPGFRVKSRSMATYTTTEVQQMREGGNAAFQRNYLARWNSSSFPAPTDKNPKKVEEFIRQVMVEKVFYSETPEEKQPAESLKPAATVQRSLPQQSAAQSLPVENSWKPFSDEGPTTNSGQSSGTVATGAANWAEFPSVTAVKPQAPPAPAPQAQPFDPFSETSPVPASPKSVHSTTADPFAPQPRQNQEQTWDPFLQSASGQLQATNQPQTAWSHFEPKPAEVQTVRRVASMEHPLETQTPSSAQNGTMKAKVPLMSPLPEEWFAVNPPPPDMHHTGTVSFPQPDPQPFPSVQQPQQQPQPQPQQQPHYSYTGGSAFGAPYQQQGGYGGGVMQPSAFGAAPQPSAFGYSAQPTRPALGSFPSFRSTASSTQHWAQQPDVMSMQKQDSMTSYVSHRVDEASHNFLFQNLDMDMRAKAHSVAGVPIQTSPHTAFQNPASGSATATAANRSGNVSFQQSFFQPPPPQTGFDEATGNPFA